MKRGLMVLLATCTLAASSGCCCMERFWIYGCGYKGEFGPYYGNEGPDAGRYCKGYCTSCAEVGRRDYTQTPNAESKVSNPIEAEPESIDGVPPAGVQPAPVDTPQEPDIPEAAVSDLEPAKDE